MDFAANPESTESASASHATILGFSLVAPAPGMSFSSPAKAKRGDSLPTASVHFGDKLRR